jgi:hypothetical protein
MGQKADEPFLWEVAASVLAALGTMPPWLTGL